MDSFYRDDARPNHSEQQPRVFTPAPKERSFVANVGCSPLLFRSLSCDVICVLVCVFRILNFSPSSPASLLVRARILQLRNPNLNLVLRRRSFVLLLEHLAQSVEDGVQLLVFDIHFL